MLTNIVITSGFVFTFILGLLLPTDPAEFADDEMWKLVSAMPAFFGVLTIMLWSLFFTEEPIAFCISANRNEEAKRHMSRVYSVSVSTSKNMKKSVEDAPQEKKIEPFDDPMKRLDTEEVHIVIDEDDDSKGSNDCPFEKQMSIRRMTSSVRD